MTRDDDESWSKYRHKIIGDLERIERAQATTLDDLGELKIMLAEIRTSLGSYGQMSERLRLLEQSHTKMRVRAGLVGAGSGGVLIGAREIIALLLGG